MAAMTDDTDTPRLSLRDKLHEVIFEADTPEGKAFDVGLIVSILLSVVVVMLDSVSSIRNIYGPVLETLEWVFTIAFSIEYVLRLICIRKPVKYALSFFGLVDLLSVLPTYISLFLPGTEVLLVIRILRVLRIFRVLKLSRISREATLMVRSLRNSGRKIAVFFFTVFTLVVIVGSVMYLVEGEKNGFTSIPRSVYWAIVTMTTVGYGDVTPQTVLGQAISSLVMILGFSIIAVPTGILASEMTRVSSKEEISTQACPECSKEGHVPGATFCMACGAKL